MTEKIIITEGGQRIDQYLAKKFSLSRSFFEHIFERGGISVNGKKSKKSYALKTGDSIDVDDLKRYMSSDMLAESPDIDIPIVLQKEDYIVINKPKGVLTHPVSLRDVKEPSVAGFLYHRYKNLPSIGDFIRAGILHRLDKNTDGLMLIALTEKGLEHFRNLFVEKSSAENIEAKEKVPLQKFYRSTCHLTMLGETFLEKLKNNLPYYLEEIVKPKIPFPGEPKIGITKILDVFCHTDLVEVGIEILTGRTHQIRYHLSNHGLPIVGDYLYGNKDDHEEMQLTAWKLVFQDPEGEMVSVEV